MVAVLLSLLLLLHAWGADAYQQLLWVARRPSRNTRGFDVASKTGSAPAVSYTIPLLEFQEALEAEGTGASCPLTFEPVLPGVAYNFGAGVGSGDDGEQRLARASRRAVLTYGLFAVLGSGLDVASVVAQAAASGAVEAEGASWRVGVVALGGGGTNDADANNKHLLEGELRPLLVSSTTGLGLDAGIEVPNERITPALDLFLFLLPEQQLLLCSRLAKGPGVGRGYTYGTCFGVS